MINFTKNEDALIFTARIVPRASKSEVIGELNNCLKVRISSPPVDGAANKELVRLLSKHFGVSKSRVNILSGETSKTKQISIENLSVEDFIGKIPN